MIIIWGERVNACCVIPLKIPTVSQKGIIVCKELLETPV